MKFLLSLPFLLCGTALAQEQWPSRPVHIVVPYTPGTGADILARVFDPKLSQRLKAGFVVDNKPGATGNIGADLVAKSPADGYTLLLTATSFTTNPALKPAPFDPVKDFAPVVLLATGALGVYVNPKVPAQSMREFVELVRQQPGKLNYSSPGNGGPQHLAMELLKLETHINIIHVPYKGAGGAIADLVGGHVQAMVSALQTVAPHVHAGRLRMLGVMSAKRAEAFPDVPTLKEQGLPDLEVETWYAMFAPAGTPAPIVARLNAELNEFLKQADVRDVLEKQGLVPEGGAPQVLGERVKMDLSRWTRVVKAAGIKAD
ncbi:MAG TPA: tripartite tricarboxylate transporter substrate binding protein [Burkholderiales bacterium]|nr:tripartite tricarboxylate transporter substrate binding protein [Burkholderiales bacterium]